MGCTCIYEPRIEYLGLILVWAVLPLMVQWSFGAEALIAHGKCLVISIFWSTLYLAIADQWAMHHGIWAISQKHSLPLLVRDLPLEEVIFFFLTATLCNFGLTLAMLVTHCDFRFKSVIDWGHNAAAAALPQPSNASSMEDRGKKAVSVWLNMTVLFLVTFISLCGLVVPESVEILIMLVSTVLIGFPHGALDPLLIHQNLTGASDKTWAWARYLGLLVLGTATWLLAPEFALFAFLLLTVYHFGEGDAQSNPHALGWVEIVARGGSFLVTIHAHHAKAGPDWPTQP